MNDMQSLLSLLKMQKSAVNLNQICVLAPHVPRSNLKEMLEYMRELRLVKIDNAASPFFPRLFQAT
jgi:predicted transcriptional regulator